jgi:hypothetical protein
MTRAEIIATLHKIERARSERVEIWVQVIEADGTLAERIYNGSFQRLRDPRTSESHKRGG